MNRTAKQFTCMGCWKVASLQESTGWIWFTFQHLRSGWLCPDCQPEWKAHFAKCQAAGL